MSSLLARDVAQPQPGDSRAEIQAMQSIAEWGPYGYRPQLAGGVVFTIVFGLCCIALTYQGIKHRRWWLLSTLAFGALAECVGNAVRIYGHFHPHVVNPYIAQQVILVLTPAFFAAAHFTILTKVCLLYGEKLLWPVRSSWLIPCFVILDVASLAVQGGGSGQAATAEINGEDVSSVNSKGNIVVAGLAIQLLGYLLFNCLFLLVVLRAMKTKSSDTAWFTPRMRSFLAAVWCSALLVLGRSIFRTIEMGRGWVGPVATTEWYYLVFDATLIALAVIILTVVSPCHYLPRIEADTDMATSKTAALATPTSDQSDIVSKEA